MIARKPEPDSEVSAPAEHHDIEDGPVEVTTDSDSDVAFDVQIASRGIFVESKAESFKFSDTNIRSTMTSRPGCFGDDALLSPPLPAPPSRWNHGLMPALSVVLSYYLDEGIGLVSTSSFMIGPTWSGQDGLLLIAFPNLSYLTIRWMYAVYIAIYALIQFSVSPATGSLSDKYGRKPVLTVCMFGFLFASIIQAITLQLFQGTNDETSARIAIGLLYSARVIRGFFGGQTGVVKAVISDFKRADDNDSTKRNKSHGNYFVYFGFTVGIGRLLGVILGTYGARSVGSYSMVFWILSAVDVLATAYQWSPFSHETRDPSLKEKRRISPGFAMRFLVWDAWFMPAKTWAVPATLLILFFFRIGWMLFANYMQVFLEGFSGLEFEESLLKVGNTWIFGTVLYLVLEYFVNQPLLKKGFSSAVIVGVEFTIQGALLIGAPFIASDSTWYAIVIPLIGLNAFGTPNVAALVAAAAPPKDSGLVLGSASALKSLTYFFAAMLTGFSSNPNILWWVSSGSFFIAVGLVIAFVLLGIVSDKDCTQRFDTKGAVQDSESDADLKIEQVEAGNTVTSTSRPQEE